MAHTPLRSRQRNPLMAILAFSAVTMSAQAAAFEHGNPFDTDSRPCGIDNHASACISDDIGDFEGKMEKSLRYIKGFGGAKTFNIKKGTLVWRIKSDEGKVTTFKIKNSYYIPQGKVKLLSSQHWMQERENTIAK
jgi:hypothetical protein